MYLNFSIVPHRSLWLEISATSTTIQIYVDQLVQQFRSKMPWAARPSPSPTLAPWRPARCRRRRLWRPPTPGLLPSPTWISFALPFSSPAREPSVARSGSSPNPSVPGAPPAAAGGAGRRPGAGACPLHLPSPAPVPSSLPLYHSLSTASYGRSL